MRLNSLYFKSFKINRNKTKIIGIFDKNISTQDIKLK